MELALDLVHDAARARLWRAKSAVRLCCVIALSVRVMNSERRFGERLQGADRLTARARVQQTLLDPMWSREALVDRRADELRSLGFRVGLFVRLAINGCDRDFRTMAAVQRLLSRELKQLAKGCS